MPGHGTIITSTSGQDEGSMFVDGTGGSDYYATGTRTATNCTGGDLKAGDVVIVDWNKSLARLEMTSLGTAAKGDVDDTGTVMNITDCGDTALSGSVNVSTRYGENAGWAEATNVSCGNVDGEAAYLCE